MTEQKQEIPETPVLDAFKRHGFGLDALVLSSKSHKDKKPHPEIGHYIAILDTNYQSPGIMGSELFAIARENVLRFVHEKYTSDTSGVKEGGQAVSLYQEIRKILGAE